MTTIGGPTPHPNAGSAEAPRPADDAPLEPKESLPTAASYRPSVGGWIGTAAGSAIGAGLGAALGCVVLGVANHGFNGTITTGARIGLAVGGLLGAVGGGLGVHSFNRSNFEKRENERINRDFGASTLQYARNLMSPFDHDHDGAIDLVNSTGLASMDERVKTETRTQSSSEPYYDFWADEWRTRTDRWEESRGTSAAGVWDAANVDPKDEHVTDEELARLMSRYDTDRDGALRTPEQEAFKAAHPVIVERWQR